MQALTEDLFSGLSYEHIAGVDEAGRGCLAGNVVAAAVILDSARPIKGLADSKKLSPEAREHLAAEIKEKALAWAVGEATAQEVDEINVLQAAMLAMKRAVEGLRLQPDFVQVDGNKLPKWRYLSEAIVKGDDKVAAISAASIIAKTTRDAQMLLAEENYPGYGFAIHKGYGTKIHLEALDRLGPCAIHRMSYAPVKESIKNACTTNSK